jgi:hypothetical protein
VNTKRFRLISVASVLSIAACISALAKGAEPPVKGAEPQAGQPAAEVFYRVVVSGGSGTDSLSRLKLFHAEMLAVLNTSDLGWKDIGCDACELLNSGPPEQTLTFALYRNNHKGMKAFLHSYLAVQSKKGHDTFAMMVDGQSPAGAACPYPLPDTCGPRKICIQTNNCDKPTPVGGPCNLCT